MSVDRCARCDGERPLRGLDQRGLPANADSADLAMQDAWAWIAGHDVCPQCQTPEERQGVAQRIAAHIEREIVRRQAKGVPPDDLEDALIRYAMSARDEARGPGRADAAGSVRLGSDGDTPGVGGGTAASADRQEAGGQDAVHLRVAFTGAFLTGHPLAVRIEGYADLQAALARRLRGPAWRVTELTTQGGTYKSGGGFDEHLPLVIARREGADHLPRLANVLDAKPSADGARSHDFAPLLSATPAELVIDVYDLGVAVLTAWFDVSAPVGQLPATARAVKQLAWLRSEGRKRSPLVDVLQEIASATAADFGDAVTAAAPAELQAAWLSRAAPNLAVSAEHGRLLWLHPVHVLDASSDRGVVATETSSLRTRPSVDVTELAPAHQKTIELEGGSFSAGIGWSAVVAGHNPQAHVMPVRLTQLHWAYFALYMELDRSLLQVLNQQRWTQRAHLHQLEQDAEDVFSDYVQIAEARARLDSHLSALGGDELAVWENIAEVQRFDAVVDAVTRKLEVLDKLAARRVELATALRARRAGNTLGWLTVLTVVTAAVAILAAVRGGLSDESGTNTLRYIVVGASVVVALIVYWLAFVRTNYGPWLSFSRSAGGSRRRDGGARRPHDRPSRDPQRS